MRQNLLLLAALALAYAMAAPAPLSHHLVTDDTSEHVPHDTDWYDNASQDFFIHPSCNATETVQLRKALADAVKLADHAKQHILRYGNSSAHYRKYFGNALLGEVIGYLDKVVNRDRTTSLFCCDNPDGNCVLPDWGGHWRGSNATGETVICSLSYETRKGLEQLCALGYTVAEYPTNFYFASDLLHRQYHMPAYGEGHVEHFTEDFAEILAQAREHPEQATHDSDGLQYFALEVYAYDIALPGKGCPGTLPTQKSAAHAGSAHHTSTHSHPTPTTTAAYSTVLSTPSSCHTHASGDVHCD